MKLILLALASVAVLLVSAEQARFDNYQILSVKIENDQQRELIESLEASFDSVQVIADLRNGFIEMVVAPHKIADVNEIFAKNDIKSEVKHMNLQEYGMEMIHQLKNHELISISFSNRLIDNEQPAVKSNRFSWTQYHNFDVIYRWLDEKLREYPRILRSVVVGRTFENRTIRGVRLSHRRVSSREIRKYLLHLIK